jgi:hypothetical protein
MKRTIQFLIVALTLVVTLGSQHLEAQAISSRDYRPVHAQAQPSDPRTY